MKHQSIKDLKRYMVVLIDYNDLSNRSKIFQASSFEEAVDEANEWMRSKWSGYRYGFQRLGLGDSKSVELTHNGIICANLSLFLMTD